jgi:hypothetical protein
LAKEELTPDAVSLTIERFQLVNDYIQKQTEIAWNECVVQRKVDLKPFKNLHPEIAHRILTKMLLEVGGHAYPLSYQSLKGLYDKIIHSGFIGATGGGCYLKKIKGGWVEVRKEERGETLAKSFLLIWK